MNSERRQIICRPWHQEEIDLQISEIRNYLAKSSMVVSLLGPRFESKAVRDIDARTITFTFSKPDHVPPLIRPTAEKVEPLGAVQQALDCCEWLRLEDAQTDLAHAFEFAKHQLLTTDFVGQSIAAGGPSSFVDEDGQPLVDRAYFLEELIRLFTLLVGFRAETLGIPASDSIRNHFAGLTHTAGEMISRISNTASKETPHAFEA